MLKLIKAIKSLGSTNATEPDKPHTLEAKSEIVWASKLEFKVVNEVYIPSEKYNISRTHCNIVRMEKSMLIKSLNRWSQLKN
jgi:hypothetical protein